MPTIPIEESDYASGSGALSGERVFKNTVPATTAREQTFNTLWHGLRRLILQEQVSTDLTGANYAAELAAGFLNLSKGIRRAARRFQSGEVTTITMTSASHTFTLTRDAFVYHIEEAASYTNGFAYPDEASPTSNDRRIIVVVNMTTTDKNVGDIDSDRVATLKPFESCALYGRSSGGITKWTPLGAKLNPGASDYEAQGVRLYDSGTPATFSAPFQARYDKSGPGNRTITLNLGFSGLTVASASVGGLTIGPGSFTYFPKHLIPIGIKPGSGGVEGISGSNGTDSAMFPVLGTVGGARVPMVAVFRTGTAGDPAQTYLYIERADGAAFTVGQVVVIFSFSMTYLRYRD